MTFKISTFRYHKSMYVVGLLFRFFDLSKYRKVNVKDYRVTYVPFFIISLTSNFYEVLHVHPGMSRKTETENQDSFRPVGLTVHRYPALPDMGSRKLVRYIPNVLISGRRLRT